MNFWLQFILTIGIFSLMLLGGWYIYKFVNNKLTSSNSAIAIFLYAILLFALLATVYVLGFVLIGLMYDYIVA
ncbi:MAG: hypothetical protein ACK5NK_15645 [Niabella sp.]